MFVVFCADLAVFILKFSYMALYMQGVVGQLIDARVVSKGSGDRLGEFERPVGVVVTPSGVVWVADSGNHRLCKMLCTLSSA